MTELTLVARFHVANSNATRSEQTTEQDKRVMMSVPFNNNGTTLHLPTNPPQELLRDITVDIPKGFNINDPEAQTISFTEIAYYSDSYRHKIAGQVMLMRSIDHVSYTAYLIYCDRPVEITGVSKDWWGFRTTYDVNLVKGWNMIIEKQDNSREERVVTFTNLQPNDMNWEYNMWIGGR